MAAIAPLRQDRLDIGDIGHFAASQPERHDGGGEGEKNPHFLTNYLISGQDIDSQNVKRSAMRSWRGPPSGLLLPPPPVVLVTVMNPPSVLMVPSGFRRRLA